MNQEPTDEPINSGAEISQYPVDEISYDPDKVAAVMRWLDLQGSWGSGKPLESYAEYAPDNVSKTDLQAVFLQLKPLGTAQEAYDIRGRYLTALADKILFEDFERQFPDGASDEEEREYWEQASIVLDRPPTGKYDRFRGFGTYWNRGTLVLRGDLDRDKDIGWGMNGGKIHVIGDAGDLGAFMSGGIIEVEGHAHGSKGYGKTGGEIVVHGKTITNSPPNVIHSPVSAVELADRSVREALAEGGEELDGALELEDGVQQLIQIISTKSIPLGVPRDNPQGWHVASATLPEPGTSTNAHLVFYDGTERSFRTPSVSCKINIYPNKRVNLVVRDWRSAEHVEGHPFDNRGGARKGKYINVQLKDGIVYNPSAGDLIDDSEEFPRVENLATQEGFGNAQLYSLKYIIQDASNDLSYLGEN